MSLQTWLPEGTASLIFKKGREVGFRIPQDPAVPSVGAQQELKNLVILHIRIDMNLPPSPPSPKYPVPHRLLNWDLKFARPTAYADERWK